MGVDTKQAQACTEDYPGQGGRVDWTALAGVIRSLRDSGHEYAAEEFRKFVSHHNRFAGGMATVVQALEKEVDGLRSTNAKLTDELDALRERLKNAEWTRDLFGADLKQANEFLAAHVDGVRPHVDKIVALHKEIKELKAKAAHWHSGPATGGSMPTEERVRLAVIASHAPDRIIVGTTQLLEGRMGVTSIYTGAEMKNIRYWSHESDLVPSAEDVKS